jgi:hypothetical protein
MLTDRDGFTLFHRGYDPATRMERYTASYFERASVQMQNQAMVTNGGLKAANVIRVRIPTEEALTIANGDKAVIGKCEADVPPAGAYTVLGFADNRRGSLAVRHWKVILA